MDAERTIGVLRSPAAELWQPDNQCIDSSFHACSQVGGVTV